MRKTMLDEAVNDRKVIAYVNGLYAPKTKTSNLYRAIIKNGYTPNDIGKKIDVVIGAHRYNYSDGWKMAIVKISGTSSILKTSVLADDKKDGYVAQSIIVKYATVPTI
jgi:hypothetical protein